ncbi:MAG: UDPGP type 1 family protein [Planctomycetaceae bacterium]|nr:UDPGP type 1 family protein [Planctomycetaceae bacterium]
MSTDKLIALLRANGQEHLLAFWDKLDAAEQGALAGQIEAIDFPLIRKLYAQRDHQAGMGELAARAEPPPAFRLNSDSNPFSAQQARDRGVQALRAGELGVILTAGGQGTRLGFHRPKGMYPIGPLSKKSLFQIHVEKIVAAARRYSVRIPLFIMTSPATHAETEAFFAEHGRFGLPEDDLMLFCQGTMPAVDERTGAVLLAAPSRIALSPDGHGGLLAALLGSGALERIENRKIRHLFYLQVDNPLVDICGPEFVGYHLLSGSEFSSQVVAKRDPLERVGNVVKVDGRLMVIEYSDLPEQAARRRNPDGSLAIWAGSIAVHVIDARLLRRVATQAESLPFHIARKKVPHVDPAGRRVEPSQPNALKFERFIFDLMPMARNAVVVEVDPVRAFSPLKNASGAKGDTPETVRAALIGQYRDWLCRAGVEVADDVAVEISPLYAMDAEELAAKVPRGMRIMEPTYLEV